MIDRFRILAGFDIGTIEDVWHLFVLTSIIFVPNNDEETVVRLGPGSVGAKILLEPGIGLIDRAIGVMHDVGEIRCDIRHARQLSKVSWEVALEWELR